MDANDEGGNAPHGPDGPDERAASASGAEEGAGERAEPTRRADAAGRTDAAARADAAGPAVASGRAEGDADDRAEDRRGNGDLAEDRPGDGDPVDRAGDPDAEPAGGSAPGAGSSEAPPEDARTQEHRTESHRTEASTSRRAGPEGRAGASAEAPWGRPLAAAPPPVPEPRRPGATHDPASPVTVPDPTPASAPEAEATPAGAAPTGAAPTGAVSTGAASTGATHTGATPTEAVPEGTGAEGSGPATPAPEPPPTGIAALRLPYQIVVALALAVIAVGALVHVGLVFLHVAPPNTLTKQHGEAVDWWVYPEFEQNWKLFAPNPLQQNIAVQARAEYKAGDGTVRTTGWYDLSGIDGAAIDGSLLPSHTEQNTLRRAWDFYTATHDTQERPSGQRGDLSERYLRRIVVMRLDREGAARPGDVLARVQVRSRTTNVPPPEWSQEKVSGKPVIRELPWWTVAERDRTGAGA